MGCLTAEMIVLLPVVRVLVLLPPLHGLWVSLGLRLMMTMEWNRFQKLKRSKKSHKDHLKSCLEQCQKPLEENIIVYLRTVCGKTHIAVLVIHKLSHLIRKPRKKICIFLPLRWLWFSRMKEWAEVCPRCHHDMPLVDFGTCLGLIGTHVGSRSIKGKSLRNSLLSQRNSRILGEVKTKESI